MLWWVVCGSLTAVALPLQSTGAGALALEESGKRKLTVYKVWASDEEREPPVKQLEKFLDQLKKTSKKRYFRLEEKPLIEELEPSGKAVTLKLPESYEARWALDKDKNGKPAVRQTLINPRKMETVDLLMRTISITQLERIQKGKETFILMVELGPPAKPQK
jgi:hypothetical protein